MADQIKGHGRRAVDGGLIMKKIIEIFMTIFYYAAILFIGSHIILVIIVALIDAGNRRNNYGFDEDACRARYAGKNIPDDVIYNTCKED